MVYEKELQAVSTVYFCARKKLVSFDDISHTLFVCLCSFSRETPTRFRKELVKSIECQGVVEKDSLNQVLVNIGRQDRLLSDQEYQVLCQAAGDEAALSTSNMMKLF